MKKGLLITILLISMTSALFAEDIIDVFELEPEYSFINDSTGNVESSFFYFGHAEIRHCFIIFEQNLIYANIYGQIYDFQRQNPGEHLPEDLIRDLKKQILFQFQIDGYSYDEALKISEEFDPESYIPLSLQISNNEFPNLLIEVPSGKAIMVFTSWIEMNSYYTAEYFIPIDFEPGVIYSFTRVGNSTDSGRIKDDVEFYKKLDENYMETTGFYIHRITTEDERIVPLHFMRKDDPFELN